jgi:glycerol-3-phosphate dehydrogenase
LRRDEVLSEIGTSKQWDVLVIGGGATGLGAALEAASRGYRTLLIEKHDFAKGTSSRSTKLVHGGVRYLEQLNLTLVLDALRERGYMLKNAPHLVHRLQFVVPIYSYSGLPYYGFGLKVYEWLSGKLSFGRSQILSKEETIERLQTIAQKDLKGGILYFDGQFNDARYAIALMRTLEDQGGFAINYLAATSLLHRSDGRVEGVRARDEESGEEMDIYAKVVINATGVFTEEILHMDSPAQGSVLAVSQGTHFVLPQSFLPGSNAMMIPKTTDGRVLFAIPWQNHVVVGTTDEPVEKTSLEPHAMEDEQTFLATNIRSFLGRELQTADVLSMWSGLRPLIRDKGRSTAKLSRDHKIITSNTGLVTVVGGKWTTYRRMGEDAVNHAAQLAGLAIVPSRTSHLQLHGWMDESANDQDAGLGYGSDLAAVRSLQRPNVNLDALLHPSLPYRMSEVVWAARYEMARTVEDVLARRTRVLFLDARVAAEIAPTVARLLADELDRDEVWIQQQTRSFLELAKGYIYHG